MLALQHAPLGARVSELVELAALLEPLAAVVHAHEHLDVGAERGAFVGRDEGLGRRALEHRQVVGLGALRDGLLPLADSLEAHGEAGPGAVREDTRQTGLLNVLLGTSRWRQPTAMTLCAHYLSIRWMRGRG